MDIGKCLLITAFLAAENVYAVSALEFAIPNASFTHTTVCQGNATIFTNNSTTQNGIIMLNIWDFGDGEGSTVINPQHVYENPGTYSVTLTVVNSQGDIDDFSALVTVHPAGNLQFLISSVNNCQSSTFGFNNLSAIPTGNFTSMQWDFGDGVIFNGTDASHLFQSHGTYTVTLTTNTDNNCANTLSKVIEVFPEAQVAFVPENACANESVTITNNTTLAEGIAAFQWEFGDGATSQEINPTHQYQGAGNYNITLTARTDKECETSLTLPVMVYAVPVPSFTTADNCFGLVSQFTNTTTIAAGTVSHFWTFGDGTTSTQTSPGHQYNAIGNYEVNLTTTSNNGCVQHYSAYINVTPRPIVDFSVANICLGQDASFTNSTTIAEGAVNYEWQFGDEAVSQNINPVHRYENYGDFDVTLTATTPDAGCTDQKTRVIQVYQQPIAFFNARDNCLDSLIRYENLTTYIGNDIQYSWNFGNGITSTEVSPGHQYTTAQIYSASLRATSAAGCISEYVRPVDVYPMPLVNFLFNSVCDGEEVVFRNLSTIASGSASYAWDFGDNTSASTLNTTHLYGRSGHYDVTLTATSERGCVKSLAEEVEIFPLPITDFVAPSVCDSKPVSFSNTSTIPNGQIAETRWDFGDETNSIVKSPTKQYLNFGSYEVILISISDRDCKTSATKTVTIYPPAIADFVVEDVCNEEPITLQNRSTIATGSLSYNWDLGDGATSVVTEPTHRYENYGLYNITLTATSETGCTDTITKPVVIFSPPAVDAGSDVSVSQGYTVPLQARGATYYAWSPITGLDNSSIANPTARPLETTDYIVTGRDQFGCENSDTVRVQVENEFRLVASNILTPDNNGRNDAWIVENVETFGDANVKVYDTWGKLVFEKTGYQNDWTGTSGGDLLPDGTYYYSITFDTTDKIYKGAVTIMRNRK